MERLDEVTRVAPGRAREAHLQIADIALSRYETARALDHAARATAGADGPTLARIAELEARAGADTRRSRPTAQAVARDAGPAATLALVRLLERRGDAPEAAEILNGLVRLSNDDETIAEAGRLATDVGELSGKLPDLGAAPRGCARGAGHARPAPNPGRACSSGCSPPLYRDPAADEVRARLGRHALRALLELVTDAEVPPIAPPSTSSACSATATRRPRCARVALSASGVETARRPPLRPPPRAAEPGVSGEARLAAVIALGRLGDPRGRVALERLSATADPSLRAAGVWGARPDRRRAGPAQSCSARCEDRRPEVAIAACLGPRPAGDSARSVAALLRAAGDAQQPAGVRRAAILGLGRMANREVNAGSVPRCSTRGDEDLARAAAMALAWSRDHGGDSGTARASPPASELRAGGRDRADRGPRHPARDRARPPTRPGSWAPADSTSTPP